jgi:hypothetical protein
MSEIESIPINLARPDFGCVNRLEAHQLRPGVRIMRWNEKYGPDGPLVVTSMPYRKSYADPICRTLSAAWWIDLFHEKYRFRSHASCADIGVIPYPHGVWNQANWCEVLEDEEMK